MDFDLSLVGGSAVVDERLRPVDIGVRDGRIHAVAEPGGLPGEATRTVDAAGAWVLPGGIDAHVHAAAPFCDDLATAARAGAAGGVTTIGVYAYPDVDVDCWSAAQRLTAWASECDTDVVVHWRLHRQAPVAEQVTAAVAHGITTFKVFMDYPSRGLMWTDAEILEAMRAVAEAGATLIVHAQCGEMVETLQPEADGDVEAFLAARPPEAEAEAIRRAMILARMTGCRLVIAHVSTSEGLAQYRRFQSPVTGIETCPQYLRLTRDAFHAHGSPAKMGIPLRTDRHLAALLDGVRQRSIDMVASDHAPYLPHEKDVPFEAAPNGVPGVETLMPLTLDLLGATETARVCSAGPARLLGVERRKGHLAPGADADILLVDPDATTRPTAATMTSLGRFTPYEGWALRGRIVESWLRGRSTRTGEAQGSGTHLARAGAAQPDSDASSGPAAHARNGPTDG